MPYKEDEGFFISDQDFEMFQQFNQEFVEEIIEVTVLFYKMDVDATESTFRGETAPQGKSYDRVVEIDSLVVPDDQQTASGEKGTYDVNRSANFGFQRERLKDKEFYPQPGDVIEWDEEFFEIDNVIDNELLGTKYFYRHSIVCEAHRDRDSNTDLINSNRQ
jgi:hypothetical protein